MIFHVCTLFPEMFSGYLASSILGKAIDANKITVDLVNIRDFAFDKHRTCDDYTYGGGPGMILKPEPLSRALESVGSRGKRTIYLTPAGRLFRQSYAEELSTEKELVLVCGKYEGIDQRIIDHYVTDEISVGDYILSSGEVAAQIVIDAVSRLIEGMISDDSHTEESFQGGLLEYPHYTRPQEFLGMSVPDVLLSGHHLKIKQWRMRKSLEKTLRFRQDLLDTLQLDAEAQKILEALKAEGEDDGSRQND